MENGLKFQDVKNFLQYFKGKIHKTIAVLLVTAMTVTGIMPMASLQVNAEGDDEIRLLANQRLWH